MLRLVGGTSVAQPALQEAEGGTPELAEPVSQGRISSRQPTPLDDQVRQLVLASETGGGTVGALLAEVNSPTEPLKTFTSTLLVLQVMGIALSTGGKSIGLRDEAFATVVDGRKLRKYVRELKTLDIAVDQLKGLGIY